MADMLQLCRYDREAKKLSDTKRGYFYTDLLEVVSIISLKLRDS